MGQEIIRTGADYNVAGGEKVFDVVVTPFMGGNVTIQVEFESFNGNDSVLLVEQALNSNKFDDIVDTAGTLAELRLDTRTRKNIITVTGTGGSATVTIAGTAKTLTFAVSIASSIDTFITANAATYLALGVTITRVGNTLKCLSDTRFDIPTIVNASGNLAGTVAGNDETSATMNIIDLTTLYLRYTFTPNTVSSGTLKAINAIFTTK